MINRIYKGIYLVCQLLLNSYDSSNVYILSLCDPLALFQNVYALHLSAFPLFFTFLGCWAGLYRNILVLTVAQLESLACLMHGRLEKRVIPGSQWFSIGLVRQSHFGKILLISGSFFPQSNVTLNVIPPDWLNRLTPLKSRREMQEIWLALLPILFPMQMALSNKPQWIKGFAHLFVVWHVLLDLCSFFFSSSFFFHFISISNTPNIHEHNIICTVPALDCFLSH